MYLCSLLFPNIEWPASDTDKDLDRVVARLRPNMSYSESIDGSEFTILSTHNIPADGKMRGFLYVPDLLESDPCVNISKPYVPSNVTRQANLPPTDFTLIAIAPWINENCTKSYLAAAKLDPMRALIFYKPDNSTNPPPPISDPQWNLHDGGRWKSSNQYPVFAVSGAMGARMIYESSLYSGNLTNVPHGHEISEIPNIDVRDYVRIFTKIRVPGSSKTPGAWAYIFVIIALLATLLALTSASMHLLLHQRRKALQNRVERGEVNLETLGIKRLTVPATMLSKMPLFVYGHEGEKRRPVSDHPEKSVAALGQQEIPASPPGYESSQIEVAIAESQIGTSTASDIHTSYSQPSCSICLEEFQANITTVQQIPCGHIFHPECIETYLSNHSSLCPLCKRSVLPLGYCGTKITNNMVRRERNMRDLRSRVTVHDSTSESEQGTERSFLPGPIRVMTTFSSSRSRRNRRIPNPISLQPHEPLEESNSPIDPRESLLGTQMPQPLTPGLSRREIAQRRVLELARRSPLLEDIDSLHRRRIPAWRKTLVKAFPGFT
ncbi:hypothetical protein BP5796_03420 [Coleophoma crateriformis]|uniref:RING-type domain-containing protein n=1 Tax=Coleophoma crateriformis TaxID=565419 RepID=A0A3D8SN62_9HELO|nr:hypothetical protein BP5796_03420 [Coleophoma crateriformis]